MDNKLIEFVNEAALREFEKLPDKISLFFKINLVLVSQHKDPACSLRHLSRPLGVIEMKLNRYHPAFRCCYWNKDTERVFVLHSFAKTTNGVDRKAMQTLGLRYKAMYTARRLS